MRHLITTILFASLLAAPSLVSAQVLLHTGIASDSSVLGNGDTDPRWTIDGSAAEVRNPLGSWLSDNGISKWLRADDGGTITIEFELTAAEAATSRIDGRLGIDDYVEEIYINDSELNVPNKIDAPNDDPWDKWVDFSVESGFVAGTNVLKFELVDTGAPGGFRAELELTLGKGYEFSDACIPATDHDLRLFTPNVTIMLDTSGSMGNDDGEDIDGDMIPDSRFKIAQAVIGELAVGNHLPGPCTSFDGATCDPVLLGLAYFSGSNALTAVPPSEDSAPAIVSSVNSKGIGGGTPIAQAVAELRDNENPLKKDIGILITDGEASGFGNMRDAIDNACDIRANGDNLFMVGFGPNSNEQANSAVAAAGGTGQCCDGGTAPCGAGDEIDPCTEGADAVMDNDNDVTSGVTCTGARTAGGSSLKDELKAIMEEGECTFPLDVPSGYPGGKAFEDPAGTRVRIKLPYIAGGYIDIPNISDTNRDLKEELQDAYGTPPPMMPPPMMGMDMGMGDMGVSDMGDMSASDMSSMDAGDMGADAGMMMMDPPPEEFAEFDGEGWEFTDSSRSEIRFTDGLCKLIRKRELTEVNTQLACACNKTGNGCSFTLEDEFLAFSTYQLERLRCTEGVFECKNGKDTCSGIANAMPEICNGFDDNCDGVIDNMGEARDDWEPYIDDGVDPEGLNCGYQNVCACEEPGHYDTPSSGTDIEDHKDSFSGACQCSENLVFESSSSEEPSAYEDVGEGAACSAGGVGATLPALMVLFGLIALGRRRE